MSIHKPNIQKYIQSQPKISISDKPKNKKASIMDGPLVSIAQGIVDNLSATQKFAIGSVIYCIISGVVANIYLLIKLFF